MKFRWLKVSALSALVALVVGAPAASFAVVADCEAAPNLATSATATRLTGLTGGATAGYYSFDAGVANPTSFPTRVSYVNGSLESFKVDSVYAKLGRSVMPLSLASQQPSSIGYINTDFFDTNTNMPASAIIHDSKIIYAPPGRTKVLGMASASDYEAKGYPGSATIKSGTITLVAAGVNMPSIDTDGTMVFTTRAGASTIAKGSYGVLVVNKKIRTLYPKGTSKRPASGYLIQAKGTAALKLRKLKVGAAVSYTLPQAPALRLVGDAITPSGYVQTNTVRVPIVAVNYRASVPTGAVLYDQNYSSLVSQWLGSKTLLLDANGKVVAFYSKGRNVVPTDAFPYVLQISGVTAASMASAVPVKDMQFKITNTYTSTGKYKLIASVGRGNKMLSAGVNVQECNYSTEQIRPRSVIGWNNYGKFWLFTSTMGRSYADGGYRQGGSTLHQMAEWLKQLGATEAYAFDGGGSTTLYANYGFGLSRIDLPPGEWVRSAPVGLVVVPVK